MSTHEVIDRLLLMAVASIWGAVVLYVWASRLGQPRKPRKTDDE